MVRRPLPEPLDDDGLNPTRALILQAYYALRRTRAAGQIGTREIIEWVERHEAELESPSPSLVQLTLKNADVVHRGRGQPSRVSRRPQDEGDEPSPPLSIFVVPMRTRGG